MINIDAIFTFKRPGFSLLTIAPNFVIPEEQRQNTMIIFQRTLLSWSTGVAHAFLLTPR